MRLLLGLPFTRGMAALGLVVLVAGCSAPPPSDAIALSEPGARVNSSSPRVEPQSEDRPDPAEFATAQQKRQEDEPNLTYATQSAATTLPTATVVSVGDGDTLRVQGQTGPITVRLACIDAPESNQAFGSEASLRLRQLLATGQAVEVRAIERDRYDRTVAELYSRAS
ncbi:thermonuclease family protein [Nodosilinea sp. E11]|uniref:thermonuclease family protein n=1 Tax=Nodosilinea sp. E11 TaxID=3037479 RepID=UPI002934F4E3|nr:thermonuclease family protein [Nodosilinea sp. E11]WOD39602.1 thermonuclease family protein [Nodosilinea sp. E11]